MREDHTKPDDALKRPCADEPIAVGELCGAPGRNCGRAAYLAGGGNDVIHAATPPGTPGAIRAAAWLPTTVGANAWFAVTVGANMGTEAGAGMAAEASPHSSCWNLPACAAAGKPAPRAPSVHVRIMRSAHFMWDEDREGHRSGGPCAGGIGRHGGGGGGGVSHSLPSKPLL